MRRFSGTHCLKKAMPWFLVSLVTSSQESPISFVSSLVMTGILSVFTYASVRMEGKGTTSSDRCRQQCSLLRDCLSGVTRLCSSVRPSVRSSSTPLLRLCGRIGAWANGGGIARQTDGSSRSVVQPAPHLPFRRGVCVRACEPNETHSLLLQLTYIAQCRKS